MPEEFSQVRLSQDVSEMVDQRADQIEKDTGTRPSRNQTAEALIREGFSALINRNLGVK